MPPKKGQSKGAKLSRTKAVHQSPRLILGALDNDAKGEARSPLLEVLGEKGHHAINFRDALSNYHDQIILKYYLTTTKGKQFKKNFVQYGHLQGVEDWIEPGYVCSDFETELGPGGFANSVSTRWFVEVPRNSEIVHEMVGEHGIVCIHAAMPSVVSTANVIADLWLVSIQNSSGKTVWPLTWIYNDDFDSLVKHATSAESENWRNTSPWEMNLIPQTLAEAPPRLRVVGITRANHNVPFRFFMTCQIRKADESLVTQSLSPPDLIEMLSSLYMQMRQHQVGTWQIVQWRSIEIRNYIPEDPLLLPHINPIYWTLNVLPNLAKMDISSKRQYLLPEEFRDLDENETRRRDEIWKSVFYTDDIAFESVSSNPNPNSVDILI